MSRDLCNFDNRHNYMYFNPNNPVVILRFAISSSDSG